MFIRNICQLSLFIKYCEKNGCSFHEKEKFYICVIRAEEAENISSMHIFYLGMMVWGRWDGEVGFQSLLKQQ